MNKPELDNDKCLSLDVMRLYQERQLSDREMHHVEKHLLDCELCSDVIEGLEVQDIPVINSIAANVTRKVASVAGIRPQVQPSFFSKFKWYFIVPAAVIMGWFAWNGLSSDLGEVTRTPVVAGNQPAPAASQGPSPVKNNEPAKNNTPIVVREPHGVEKIVPSPVTNAPAEKNKPEVKTDEPVAINTTKEPEVKVPENADNNAPSLVDDKAGSNNNNTNKTLPAPDIDHAPLKLIEVKVISKVAAAGGTRKTSKSGQVGSSKTGSVDDGMQPHEMPVFYGGDEAMKTWLIRSFQDPVKDKSGLKGKTTAVIFDVSSKGKIDNIEVTKSLSKELDAEVIRLIGNMPQWKAASKKGTITVVLAITFK